MTNVHAIQAEQLTIDGVMQQVWQQRRRSGVAKLLSLSSVAMVLALPIGVLPRIIQSQELDTTQAKSIQKLPFVSLAKPLAAPKQRTISLPGTIQAIEETAVYARSDGYVKQRFADIGDEVKAGQLLAIIETPEIDSSTNEARAQLSNKIAVRAQMEAGLDQAKADLAKAIAEVAQAKSNVTQIRSDEKLAYTNSLRWKSLAAQGAVSAADADDRQTRFETSSASRQAAEERVAATQAAVVAARAKVTAEQSSLRASEADISAARANHERVSTEQGFQRIEAPFAGVITERNIEPGSLVTSGSENSKFPMFRLAQIQTLKVFVDVPQYSAPSIKKGQRVSIDLKEFPGRHFTGVVARTSVALDPTARTLKTEIHIPNSAGTLAPGMYADASFSLQQLNHVLLIPGNSLILRAEGPQVAVVSGNSIQIRTVKLGDDLGKQVEVVAGLSETDKVVVNPNDSLKSGTLVSFDNAI